MPRSYVLRCLPTQKSAEDELAWRFSIQEAAPEARRHAFGSLDELVTYLRAELERALGANEHGK